MNRYSQLLKLASKLDNKGLVKEADSIEKLVKLAFGPEQQLSLSDNYRAMPQSRWRSYNDAQRLALQEGRNYHNMTDSIYPRQHPLAAYNIRRKYGESPEYIINLGKARDSAMGEIYDRDRTALFNKLWPKRSQIPAVETITPGVMGNLAPAVRATSREATPIVEEAGRIISKPSTLRKLGPWALGAAGLYGLYKLLSQGKGDLGPQPSGPQPIYPGAYTPPTGMYLNMTSPQRPPGVSRYAEWSPQNKKWSIHGEVFDYCWDEYGNKLKDPRQNFIPGTTSPQATSQAQLSPEIEKRLQAIYDQQVPPPSYNPPEWGEMVPADKSYI